MNDLGEIATGKFHQIDEIMFEKEGLTSQLRTPQVYECVDLTPMVNVEYPGSFFSESNVGDVSEENPDEKKLRLNMNLNMCREKKFIS